MIELACAYTVDGVAYRSDHCGSLPEVSARAGRGAVGDSCLQDKVVGGSLMALRQP
jgi:hypothetical protein